MRNELITRTDHHRNRPITWRLRSLLTAFLAIALFATACGASSDEESVVASETVEETDAASGGDEADDSSEDETEADSEESGGDGTETLEGLLGPAVRFVRGGGRGAGGQFNADPAEIIEQQRQVEEAIRSCMLAQGFEYTMSDVSETGRAFGALANQGAELTPEEYAAQEGLGLSTRFDALLNGGLQALGATEADDDPNQALLDSMSQGEADAWEIALDGVPPERDAEGRPIDPETGEVIERGGGRGRGNLNNGGCRSEANETVRGDFTALAELADEFEELDARIDADPRIVEIGNEWQECMSEAGYFYTELSDARDEIRQEFRPIVISALGFGPGGPRPGQAADDNSATGLDAETEALLAELQDKERAIAVANYDCSAETADEAAEIRARYESEFIDANRAVLESVGN